MLLLVSFLCWAMTIATVGLPWSTVNAVEVKLYLQKRLSRQTAAPYNLGCVSWITHLTLSIYLIADVITYLTHLSLIGNITAL